MCNVTISPYESCPTSLPSVVPLCYVHWCQLVFFCGEKFGKEFCSSAARTRPGIILWKRKPCCYKVHQKNVLSRKFYEEEIFILLNGKPNYLLRRSHGPAQGLDPVVLMVTPPSGQLDRFRVSRQSRKKCDCHRCWMPARFFSSDRLILILPKLLGELRNF